MTARERRTFVLAACLLLVASFVRWGWERRQGPPLLPADSSGIRDALLADTRRARAEADRRRRPLEEGETIDPNRAPAAELDRLPGVGPAVADAIVRERTEGGGFAVPDDLERVRGIGEATAGRMAPHLDFTRPVPVSIRVRSAPDRTPLEDAPDARAVFRPLTGPGSRARVGAEEGAVDLNRATAVELEELSGIGPALSARILELRRRKGRFRRIEELLEVRGIGPATLERLRAGVVIGG